MHAAIQNYASVTVSDLLGLDTSIVPEETNHYSHRGIPLAADTDCPLCGMPLKKIDGKYGTFFGCSAYPKCKGKRKLK